MAINPLAFLDPSYDPSARFLALPSVPGMGDWDQPSERKPAAFPPLDEQQTDSLIGDLLGSTMGGVQYAAETLAKPQRALFGALAGKPEELLNLIPFSDTLGLTDPANSVSGRDLLETYGVLGANQEGLDAGDVAGFALDMVADPLNFFGPLALTKAGRAAAKVGKAARKVKPITKSTDALMEGVQISNALDKESLMQSLRQLRGATDNLDEVIPGVAKSFDALTPAEMAANPVLHGYFDPRTGKVAMRPGIVDKDGFTTLAHELEHANQDKPLFRWFSGKKYYPPDPNVAPQGYFNHLLERRSRGSGDAADEVFGKLGPTISHQVDQGQRALFQARIPFTDMEMNFGTGDAAVNLAGKYIDPALDYLRFANPISKVVGPMLKTNRYDMATPEAQRLAADFATPRLRQTMTEKVLPWQEKLAKFDQEVGGITDAHIAAMRDGGELDRRTSGLSFTKYQGDASLEAAYGLGKEVRDWLKPMTAELKSWGVKAEPLADDLIDYLARYHRPDQWVGVVKTMFEDGFKLSDMVNAGRLDFLKNIRGGTNMINDLLNDPRVMTPKSTKDAVQIVKDQIFVRPPKVQAGSTVNPAAVADEMATKQAERFVAWAHSLDADKYVSKTLPDGTIEPGAKFFNSDPISDAILRQKRHVTQVNHAQFAYELMGQVWKKYDDPVAAMNDGYVSIPEALKAAKLTYNKPVYLGDVLAPQLQQGRKAEELSKIVGFEGAKARAAEMLGLDPLDVTQVQVKKGGRLRTKTDIRGLENYYIPREAADDIARFMTPPSEKSPATKKVLNLFDNVMNLWKGTSTQIWPSFHARNALSGLFYHLASGAVDPKNPLAPFNEAYNVLTGQAQPGLQSELLATGVWKPGLSQATDTVGAAATAAASAPLNPPIMENGVIQAIKDGALEALQNVQDAPGIKSKIYTAGAAGMQAGRAVGNFTEDLMRIGHYIARRNQGYSVDAAAQSVKKWFFDYGDLTAQEREVYKRLFPFWKYAKENTELVVKELLKNPGGLVGKSIRAMNAPRQDDGFIPDYVSEGLAIPLEGDGRFLTNFGLPVEQALENFSSGPTPMKSVQRNLQGILGMTNPLIKGASTAAFGIDPFTGRDLNELYKFPTDNVMFNAAANLFAGTPLSKARTMLDDRKGATTKAVNLLTGARITDISGGMDRAREFAARKLNEQMMRESPNIRAFTRYYADPEQVKNLTPEEIAYLRLQETLTRQARKVRKGEQSNKSATTFPR